MRRPWFWVATAGLIVALVAGAYFVARPKRTPADRMWTRFPSVFLGVRAGEVVPRQGRAIRYLRGIKPAVPLRVPVVLYPHARILGVNVSVAYEPLTNSRLPTLSVLMLSEDAERQVMAHYLTEWKAHGVREIKQMPSMLYKDIVPTPEERTVVTVAKEGVFASVSVARGPALRVVDDVVFANWLLRSEGKLPLEPGGRTATTIWLIVPICGKGAPPSRPPVLTPH